MKKSLKRNKKSRKTARIRRRPKRLKRLSRGRGGIVSSKKKTKRKHRRKLKGGMNEGVTRDIHTLDIIAHPLNSQKLKMTPGHFSDRLTFDFTDDTVVLYYPRRINNDYDYLIPDEERRFVSKPTNVHKNTVGLDKGYLVDCIYQEHGGFRNDTVGKKVNLRTHTFTVENSYIVKPINGDEPIVIDCGNNINKRKVRDLFLKFPDNNEQIRLHAGECQIVISPEERLLTVRKKLILTRGLLETTSINFDLLGKICVHIIPPPHSFIVKTTLHAGEDDADDEDSGEEDGF